MKGSISYKNCKIVTLTDLMKWHTKIWKNVTINPLWLDWYLSTWIEISDNVQINWLNGFYCDETCRIKIWKFCCIAVWASFMARMHHNYKHLSVYVWDNNYFRDCFENVWETITIWNDVWIWRYACILKWVTVWNWAVIWAWAVVTKDVPPYAIVWGNPAKIIKYRFDEDTIKKLQKSEWWNWDIDKIKANYKLQFLERE